MIHTPSHTSHPAHPAHMHRRRLHYRSTLRVMLVIVIATLAFALIGYFAGVEWKTLLTALVHTTYRLALAYAIALVIGAGIALLLGTGRLSNFLFPVFDVLQNIPSFALIPLFIYFLGYGDLMIIVFSTSSIVWPILFSAMTAIRGVRSEVADAATVFGARGLKRILYFYLPLSFPALITGSIVGIAIGWETVIGSEIIARAGGFGAFITLAGAHGFAPSTVAGIIAILFLVFVINRLVWAPLLSESTHRYAD